MKSIFHRNEDGIFLCLVGLYGSEFKVYSDNVTAVSFLRKKNLSGKFARRVKDLAEYDFQILHYFGPSDVVSGYTQRLRRRFL